jgi:hypothetical protein
MSYAITMEAGEFLTILRYEGALPGVAKNQSGLFKPADEDSEIAEGLYPIFRSFHLFMEQKENPLCFNYTVNKTSPDGKWKLVRAWRSGVEGQVVEECPPNLLVDPMKPIHTRKAGEFIFRLRLKGQLPGLPINEKGSMRCQDPPAEGLFDTYPVSRTYYFRFENRDIQTVLHYTAVKMSKISDWQLQKAWRSDENGQIVEQYPTQI